MSKVLLLFCWALMPRCSDKTDSSIDQLKGDDIFIASTPANRQLKAFLGIPVSDSVDFVRWQLIFRDSSYTLNCHYGIGKPNTNEFINGGHKRELAGGWFKEDRVRTLKNGMRQLNLVEISNNILHLMDTDGKLMIGNGGWSYTLNNKMPNTSSDIFAKSQPGMLKDSTGFEGRSPDIIPGIPSEPPYNKLKWDIVLFANRNTNTPTTYRAISAPWRSRGGKTGNWKIVHETDGRCYCQLLNEDGSIFLNLLKADDGILLIADHRSNLLVGNGDFSYTLNKYF